MNEAIQVCDLHYTYPDAESEREHIVFDGLNLSIEAGSFVAVLGHNGCGKSTLAKHLNAILLPEGGTVTVYGLDTKQEENLWPFVQLVSQVLSDKPLFVIINSYTTGLAPSVVGYIMDSIFTKRFGGHSECGELGLPVKDSGLVLPCGSTGRWTGK